MSGKLGAVVGPDVGWHSSLDDHAGKQIDEIVAIDRARWMKAKALARVLIDERQNLDRSTVFGPIKEEVIGPNMVLVLGPLARARVL